jgi:hypothetical protein
LQKPIPRLYCRSQYQDLAEANIKTLAGMSVKTGQKEERQIWISKCFSKSPLTSHVNLNPETRNQKVETRNPERTSFQPFSSVENWHRSPEIFEGNAGIPSGM